MAKGAAIKFENYESSVNRLLDLLRLKDELKKHSKIVLKPFLGMTSESTKAAHTPIEFVEAILRYCLKHKNPATEIFIMEGCDGANTEEVFISEGYYKLAERYDISLLDLNTTDVEETYHPNIMKFQNLLFPKVLEDSFLISIPKLARDPETVITGGLSNILGMFPSEYYSGLFTKKKSKLRAYPLKYAIHDMACVKTPKLAVIDASEQGYILAGLPVEVDKRAAKLLELDPNEVHYIKFIDEHDPARAEQESELDGEEIIVK